MLFKENTEFNLDMHVLLKLEGYNK